MRKLMILSLYVLMLLAVCGAAANAAVTTVHVFCCAFSINPAGQTVVQATITAGDTIHWVFDGANHNVKSVNGSAETFMTPGADTFQTQLVNATFDHTFNTPGTYSYLCTIHGTDNNNGTASGMAGTITVLSPVRVSALALAPTTVVGPKPSIGTVTLSAAAAAGGFVVNLSSNNAAAAVPATITVAAGATSGTFTIKTKAVSVATKPSITAAGGGGGAVKMLTVNPIGVKALVLSPDSVVEGDGSTGVVVLDAPAPAGGIVVTLAASTTFAGVPASITIPVGSVVGTFAITTPATAGGGTSVIKATANKVAKTATLTVSP